MEKQLFLLNSLCDFDQGVSRIVAARKTGLIDSTGNLVLEPKAYELILPFDENGLAKVAYKQFGQFGLINTEGQEIIPPSYDEIDPFYNGFARVQKLKRYGFISLSGEEMTPPKLYDAYKVSEGKVAVQPLQGGPWYFMDIMTGEIINGDLPFLGKAMYSEGKTILRHKNENDFIIKSLFNEKGDTIASSHSNFEIIFYKDGMLGLKETKIISADRKTYHYHFRALDEKRFRSPPRIGYTNMSPFLDGVSVIRMGKNCAMINTDANQIVALKYKGIKRVSEGNYKAVPASFSGLFSPDGKMVLKDEYDLINVKFQSGNGIYAVEKGDQLGYVDGKGNWLWEIRR